jgi:hypothetical protein
LGTRALAVDQLGFYWDAHLWPRLRGLTDEEYFWEPVPGAWSVRPDAQGVLVQDGARVPPPVPPPVTTIAWRIVHIAVGVFHTRASTFFGDGSVAEEPMAALALHLNRETMHHGGEIGVLRDLYRATGAASRHDHLAVSPTT